MVATGHRIRPVVAVAAWTVDRRAVDAADAAGVEEVVRVFSNIGRSAAKVSV